MRYRRVRTQATRKLCERGTTMAGADDEIAAAACQRDDRSAESAAVSRSGAARGPRVREPERSVMRVP
jgi:hypothetical protein